MNCETVRTLMSEYIDRLLDPERATSFRTHLDECPACRRDLAAMEKTVALVRSMEPVAPPADLIQSVHARLEAGEKPRVSLWPMKVKLPVQRTGLLLRNSAEAKDAILFSIAALATENHLRAKHGVIWRRRVFQPVLAIAAGLVLVAGIGAYFLIEHGRHQEGFTVASVEHKQAFEKADVNRNQAEFSVKLVKDEASRAAHIRESQEAIAGKRQKEAKVKMSANKDTDQKLRLENKAVALRSQNAVAAGRAEAEAGAGGGSGQPMAPAPIPVQADQARAVMEKAAAKFTGRPQRAGAGAAGGAGKGAARPSSQAQRAVNLTVATTNRAAVEQILLAFDVKWPRKNKQQVQQVRQAQQVKLESTVAAAPVFAVLEQNAMPARESDQVIVITLAASQLQDLLAQLKLQGTISVADHDRQTAQAPSKMKAGGSMPGAAVESSDLLTVHAIITVP